MRRLLHLTLAILSTGALTATSNAAQRRSNLEKNQAPTSSAPVAAASTKADLEADRYAVYSALIKDLYVSDDTKLLVIDQDTSCITEQFNDKDRKGRREFEDMIFGRWPELKRDTIEGYYATEHECYSLSKRLDIPVKYELFTAKDAEQIFSRKTTDTDPEDSWRRFYAKYPDARGSINVSNVGFSREMDQAVVFTGIGCGSLCGQGYCVLLTKEQGAWNVKGKLPTWVS